MSEHDESEEIQENALDDGNNQWSRKDKYKLAFIIVGLLLIGLFFLTRCVDFGAQERAYTGPPAELPAAPGDAATPSPDPFANAPGVNAPHDPLLTEPSRSLPAPTDQPAENAAADTFAETDAGEENGQTAAASVKTGKEADDTENRPTANDSAAPPSDSKEQAGAPPSRPAGSKTPAVDAPQTQMMTAIKQAFERIHQLEMSLGNPGEQTPGANVTATQQTPAELLQAACPDCRPVEHILLDLGYLQQVLQQIEAVQQATATIDPDMYPLIKDIIVQEYPRLSTLIPAAFNDPAPAGSPNDRITVEQITSMITTSIDKSLAEERAQAATPAPAPEEQATPPRLDDIKVIIARPGNPDKDYNPRARVDINGERHTLTTSGEILHGPYRLQLLDVIPAGDNPRQQNAEVVVRDIASNNTYTLQWR